MQEDLETQVRRSEAVQKTVKAYMAARSDRSDPRHYRLTVAEAIERHIGDRPINQLTTDNMWDVLAALEQQAASRRAMRRLMAVMCEWLMFLDTRQWIASHECTRLWNCVDIYRHNWEIRQKRRTSEVQQLYRMYDAHGQLLYVGISGSALARMVEHAKSKPWIGEVARVDIVTIRCSRKQMEDHEAQVIQSEKPRHNVMRMTRRIRSRLTAEQERELGRQVAAKHC